MKIQKTDSGCYFVEPVCSDEEKLMEAISIAVKFFNESYYPKDEPYQTRRKTSPFRGRMSRIYCRLQTGFKE